jgi:hypothetical protein
MNLGQCLRNLRHDIGNGGLEEDTFAMNCYITMANRARRLLKSNASDQREATEYLALCSNSGSDSLRCIVEG